MFGLFVLNSFSCPKFPLSLGVYHSQTENGSRHGFILEGGREGAASDNHIQKSNNDKQSTEKYVLFYSIIPITKAIFHKVSGDTIY